LTEEEDAVEDTVGVEPGAKGENLRDDERQVIEDNEQIDGHGKYGECERVYWLLRNDFTLH
jgi:hypothetical protein